MAAEGGGEEIETDEEGGDEDDDAAAAPVEDKEAADLLAPPVGLQHEVRGADQQGEADQQPDTGLQAPTQPGPWRAAMPSFVRSVRTRTVFTAISDAPLSSGWTGRSVWFIVEGPLRMET